MANHLSREKRELAIRCMVEGKGIRGVSRIADIAKNTAMNLLVAAGAACAEFHDKRVRSVPTRTLQVDEIWSYIYCKNSTMPKRGDLDWVGNCWTWIGIEGHSKVVIGYLCGSRDAHTADKFFSDLVRRIDIQEGFLITSDGLSCYPAIVEKHFDMAKIAYAIPHKYYVHGEFSIGGGARILAGDPEKWRIHNNYIERQNRTLRMTISRFARYSDSFSKKLENHKMSVALYAFYYNFCRIHRSLRVTPAMAAGLANRLYDISDIVDMVEARTPKPNRPKVYNSKKKAVRTSEPAAEIGRMA